MFNTMATTLMNSSLLPPTTTASPSVLPDLSSSSSAVDYTTTAAALLDAQPALQHNQISFEIPSHRDLEHINSLHSFNTLLQRIGNVAYDTIATGGAAQHREHANLALAAESAGTHAAITSEQISKSVVLDLADLKSDSVGGLERFFAGADMNSIINYLWIGVVTSLVILSVVFIIFSCYFYRKFRDWKKCNKDIRAHLHNDMYPGGRIVNCDSLLNANGQAADGAAYYQMESPPCYTIATGLPTYDEALHHQQHFSYGMKFVYPAIAAVHHHPAMSGVGVALTAGIVSNWQKPTTTASKEMQQQQQQQKRSSARKLATWQQTPATPPYDAATAAASVALLSTTPEKSEAISICMQAPADVLMAANTSATTTTTDDKAYDNCSAVVVA